MPSERVLLALPFPRKNSGHILLQILTKELGSPELPNDFLHITFPQRAVQRLLRASRNFVIFDTFSLSGCTRIPDFTSFSGTGCHARTSLSLIPQAFRFFSASPKLYPSHGQLKRLDEWQSKIRSLVNLCLADRIDTYRSTFTGGEFCDLRSKGVADPLACSVSKSATLGDFWKEDNPSRRRSKKPFNPRRTAYEIHSSLVTNWRQTKPWYADICADVLQQALRNLDKAFNNLFSGRSKFPRFKRTRALGLEFKPGTVKLKNNKIKFPVLGWMKFAKSREIIEVNPRGSSQECHKCGSVSPKNRDSEKFVCENCGYYEDADTQAGKVLAQCGQQKQGIDPLRVVSPKVTTKPELTGSHS